MTLPYRRPYDAPLEWPLHKPLHTNASCSLVLRMARAASPMGPWALDTAARGSYFPDALSRPCVEGPTALREPNGSWLLLFDSYRTDCLLIARPEPRPSPPGEHSACGVVAGRRAEISEPLPQHHLLQLASVHLDGGED